MNRELRMSYETMGSTSYMTVICPPTVGLVNFELEMLMANEVKNFLPVSRQMLDGETVIYYNITSRIPLRQVLDKRKLSRKELFRLIDGAILAVRDAAAFRLASNGIALEPEYIYVNPASCAPDFMFIPVEVREKHGIKELISELILHDCVEMSNDNFIQILLMELNRKPFSLKQLEKSLAPYKIVGNQKKQSHDTAGAPINNMKPIVPQSEILEPAVPRFEKLQPSTPPPMKRPEVRGSVSETSDNKTKVLALQENNTKENKKKFLLPQALVMVALAASISFGAFTEAGGGIALKNILVFAIIVATAEFILYREIYVNGKQSKKEKAVGPELPCRPEPPAPLPVKSAKPQLENVQPMSVAPVQQPIAPPAQYPVHSMTGETDFGDETELWDGGENDTCAYLEYYENGEKKRISLLPSEGIVVGRLKQQVDIAVKSLKVGKVHAKFSCQDGQCSVIDINSKNGTYINGSERRIESNIPYSLHDKDKIMLADLEFILHYSEN